MKALRRFVLLVVAAGALVGGLGVSAAQAAPVESCSGNLLDPSEGYFVHAGDVGQPGITTEGLTCL